jgi:hypothetical protein
MKTSNIFFYFILILVITICTILNYYADVMGSMLPLYIDFENFFKLNFDYNYKFVNNFYTFPMWGYGLVLLIFRSKLLIILFQQILTFFTIILIDNEIRKNYKFINIIVFRFLILISVQWYFFHTSLWPYSINANLLQLSILYLSKYIHTKELKYIIITSILYGILLNFRSDYYYFMLIIIIVLIIQICNGTNFKALIIFIIITNTLLIPWGAYTLKRTNHYLQTSTNSGHVFYISLGQLPNNIWKITPKDEDSSMHSLLKNKFKSNNSVNTLTYESSNFLMEKWKRNVITNPTEYLKKCGFNMIRIITNPFYPGNLEMYFSKSNEISIIKNNIKNLFNNLKIVELIKYFLFGDARFYLITFIINAFGVILFLTFIALNFYLFIKQKFKICLTNPLVLFSNFIIIYQLLMCVLVFFMPIYNTNIFLSYIISISCTLNKIKNGSKFSH